jgi:hypothetical protein
MSCYLNLHCDAAILLQSDRIGADVNAIAAQILSRPQIKRAIVQRTHDGCSTNEAVAGSPAARETGSSAPMVRALAVPAAPSETERIAETLRYFAKYIFH